MSEATAIEHLALPADADLEQLLALRAAQAQSPAHRRKLESLVIELMENPTIDGRELSDGDAALVIGAGLWALGRVEEAIASLANADSPDADLLIGRCYLEVGFHARAIDAFGRAKRGKAATRYLAELGAIEAAAKDDNPDEALEAARALANDHSDDPMAHYLVGLCLDLVGGYDEAIAAYEQSLELDPDCDAAAFRLGFDHARKGRLDAALEHYAAIASRTATYFNALINLGVLCEDRREYSTAIECYRRVLRSNPNHTRARMYLKDAHASLDMVYDEDRQRELDRRQQLLAIPVTDFELSVRVRNCLQRMNIITVGDLAHHTEEELLTSKNFGETSLQEIKEMLVARGLRLGQDREDLAEPTLVGAPELGITPASPPDELVLSTPISELDLSLRSRKCMERLGLATIGQLCERSADELLGSRNFGRTSLAEVGEKLARYGLALRQPPPEETEDEDDDEAPPIDDGQ